MNSINPYQNSNLITVNASPNIKQGNVPQISLALYEEISRETAGHICYLSRIGLEERAAGIKCQKFQFDTDTLGNIDITPFQKRTPIPQEVVDFDPRAKNTLITTDPHASHNKAEDSQEMVLI